jgi:hypothetical protein
MLVLENVIRDSVTYTEHAKRKTGMSILLDLTLQTPILHNFILSIYYYTLAGRPPPTQHPWHSAPFNPYIICS